MTLKTITFKNNSKILFSAGILLLSSAFIPLLADYRDFFLFAGISFLSAGIIKRFFHPKIVYRDMSEIGKIPAAAKQTTIEKPVLKMPFSMKQNPVTMLLFFIIIGGFLVNQLLLARYNNAATSNTNTKSATSTAKASLAPFDQSIISELGQQGNEIPVLGTAHDHADLNVYNNGERLIIAKPENYMKSMFVHIDPNQNSEDANSVLHMHARNVPLWLFFRSIGVNLKKDSLTLADGQVLKNENGNTLKFYLNEQKVDELSDYSFQPLDKLLISYGPENDPNLEQQIKAMTNFAKDHQK